MMDQREANYYQTYMPYLTEATIRIVPPPLTPAPSHTPTSSPSDTGKAFIKAVNDTYHMPHLDDLFTQKKELSEDRLDLIFGEIEARETLKRENLAMLYDDLMRIRNWRMDRPFPEYYLKDRTWSEFNRMELQIRDQIRRELKDAARDTSFPQKDLRDSLLEFKLQSQRTHMMEGDLGMGAEGSLYTPPGDYHTTY